MKSLSFFLLCFLVAFAARAQPVTGSQLCPVNVKGLWGYVDNDGDVAIRPQFQAAGRFYEGLAATERNGKWGFVNAKGKTVIDFNFDTAAHFSEGWCAVGIRLDSMPLQWTYVNAAGQTPLSNLPALGFAGDFHNNRALVSEVGFDEPFVIDGKGQRLFGQGDIYFFTDPENNHYAEGILKAMKPFGASGLYHLALLDTTGTAVTSFNGDYSSYGAFHEGMMWYSDNGKYGFIDRTGKEVIKAKYDTVMDFSEGTACACEKMKFDPNTGKLSGGQCGYINTLGEWTLAPKPRVSFGFHNGLARVLENGKWGYMNTSGQTTIEAQYDEASDFDRGFARVKKGGRWAYINPSGKAVWTDAAP